jgi:hypothetical protein
MSATVDYKSKELTLYNDGGYKLQVRPIDGSTDAGPGFSIKTTNLENAGDWGVHIPMLKVDTMYGVRNVGSLIGMHEYYISQLNVNLPAEVVRATNAEASLQANINAEAATRLAQDNVHSASIAQEISDRQGGDYQLDAKLSNEVVRAQAAELVLTNNLAQTNLNVTTESKARADADSKINDAVSAEVKARSEFDLKITNDLGTESKARSDADIKLGSDLAFESGERKSEVKRIDGRIDFIVSNSDQASLDSLAEIVANFNVNGASYASRLTYLEGVIASLVNKSQ